jgi:hypothetical protein
LHTRLLLPLPTERLSLPFLQRRLLRLFTPLRLRLLDLLPLGRPGFLRRPLFFLHTRLLLPLPTERLSLPFLQRRLLRLFTPLRLRIVFFMLFYYNMFLFYKIKNIFCINNLMKHDEFINTN